MGQPTPTDVHADAPLTDLSIAYIQEETNFIAEGIFPTVSVAKQTDKFYTYTKNDWFRDEAKKRAPSSESAGSGFGLSTDTYSCDVWAFHKDIDDQVRANADAAINLDADAARWVTQVLLIRRERQFVSDYFGAGIWDTNKVGGSDFTKWSDVASDPQKDIQDGVKTMMQTTGLAPNVLAVAFDVHQALQRHPLIKDQYKHVSAESITADMIARFFELDAYLIFRAAYATNEEGATGAYSFIAGSDALLVHRASAPGLLIPSAGYNFVWTGLTGMSDLGFRINTLEMPLKKADRIEGEFAFDMKPVATDLGYFFSGAV